MIAVWDTGPLQYLSLIKQIGLLPQIFEKVLVPQAVADELSHPSTPPQAAALIAQPPAWLEVCTVKTVDAMAPGFGPGETEAFALTISSDADVLLTDDAGAKSFAKQTSGMAASGTIGVLYEAAKNHLIPFTATDFDQAIDQLLATTLRSTPTLRNTIEGLSLALHRQQDQRGSVP